MCCVLVNYMNHLNLHLNCNSFAEVRNPFTQEISHPDQVDDDHSEV